MKNYIDYSNNDSIEEYNKFFNGLSQEVQKKVASGKPLLTGMWEKDYSKRIQNLTLNQEGLNVSELSQYIASYFKGVIRWHYPLTLHNVKSPINIYAAATSAISMLYDVNMGEDINCGSLAGAELEVIQYLSEVAGWGKENTGGYFTFGGTGILLNALKIGINKAIPDVTEKGVREEIFIVCSEHEHHSVVKVCNWLGIGKNNCVMIPSNDQYQFDTIEAKRIIIEKLRMGCKLVGIVACGGTTVQSIIDPIKDIVKMRNSIVEEANLDYSPHVHVDSVISWPLLFFKDYSFSDNELKLSSKTREVIEKYYTKLSEIIYADSFGADFHKSGFCPFTSSALVVKRKQDLLRINGEINDRNHELVYGEYTTADYVLECSRPSSGIMSALAMLKVNGINGMRIEFSKMTNANILLQEKLNELEGFEVINPTSLGICVLFVVSPPYKKTNYSSLPMKDIRDIYRFAKYNHAFYVYCLKHMNQKGIFFDYSSGYERGKNGVFIGVHKMQSLNPLVDERSINHLILSITDLKKNFDNDIILENYSNLPYPPKPLKILLSESSMKKIKFTHKSIY